MARGGSVDVEIRVNNFPRIMARFPEVVKSIIAKATLDTYNASQVTVPVRKDQRRVRGGFLKNSGQTEVSGFEGTVTYTAYYAIYVHEGTRYMPARPFLENALQAQIPGITAAFASLESRL
jgi:HK97 gp10 family phage protein